MNIGSVSIADECAAELRSHDGRHATGTTDFEMYISMFVPQSSGCFPLCLSLHGTCRPLAQMYILVTHMIALQLPFHLTTVGPLAPYKSCVSHPCIARACTDCDPTIWYFVFILFHRSNVEWIRKDSSLCHDLTPPKGDDEVRDGKHPDVQFILDALARSLVVLTAEGSPHDHSESFKNMKMGNGKSGSLGKVTIKQKRTFFPDSVSYKGRKLDVESFGKF